MKLNFIKELLLKKSVLLIAIIQFNVPKLVKFEISFNYDM